jgi:GT2 family glycosyltransferase
MVSATPSVPRSDATATLGVVVVDHHRPDLLADALRALDAGDRQPDAVVVVAAETTEAPTLPAELAWPPQGRDVVVLPDNPGYSAACNRGWQRLATDWILFLNADVVVDPTCLGSIMEAVATEPGIGIVTCRLMKPDGTIDHACHRGIPSVLDALAYKLRLDRLAPGSRRLGHYRLTWLDPVVSHDVEACSGAFLCIRREALEAVGGWDERYRFYAEDLDLCLRVRRAGWRVRYVSHATALHLKGASSHFRRRRRDLAPHERLTRARARSAAIDSHQLFYREHLRAGTPRLLRLFVEALFAVQRRLA